MTKHELIAYIETFLTDGDGKLVPARTASRWLKKRNMFNILNNWYSDSTCIRETIYRLLNDLDVRPVCKMCGKRLRFVNSAFPTYCSPKCRNTDPNVIKKNSDSVSRSLKRAYKERGAEIKNKRAKTIKEKYGIESSTPFSIKEVQDKVKNTVMERFGVDNIFRLKEYRSNREYWQKYSVEYQKALGYDIEYVLDENGEYKVKVFNCCHTHGDVIMDLTIFGNRTKRDRKDHTILCPICNPLRNPETSIETIIKNILIKNNINFEHHNRSIIKPLELDFYLPEYHLAIECNGIYWHSGIENKNKHIIKFNACKNAGVQLMYFWEDEILLKPELVEDIICSHLGLNMRIFARKCKIKEISSKEAKVFLNDNHFQGNVTASIRYGLFYNDELVQVMTFGKLRKCVNSKSEDSAYELYRLCSKNGLTVVGGASKLLNHFIKTNNPKKIISYCSKSISNGNVYEKLGFKYTSETSYGFSYVNGKTYERKNRFTLRKDVVDDNSGRTADEIINEMGYLKCYDLGVIKYELNC